MKYPNLVSEYFEQPRHVGALEHGFRVHIGEAAEGDVLQLDIAVDTEQKIQRCVFKALGNPYTIAAAEWLCRELEAKPLSEVNIQQVITDLELPGVKRYLLILLDELIKQIQVKVAA